MNLMKLLNMVTSQAKVPLSSDSHPFQFIVVWEDSQACQDLILKDLKLKFLFHLIKESLQNCLILIIDLGDRRSNLFYL